MEEFDPKGNHSASVVTIKQYYLIKKLFTFSAKSKILRIEIKNYN